MPDTSLPSEESQDALAGGEAIAPPTLIGLLDGAAEVARHATSLAKASASLAAESVKISVGRSEVAPEKSDWRFKDPTWTKNPVYRRMAQAYLAGCRAADGVLSDVDQNSTPQRAQRARFVVNLLTSAAAPTNTLLGNPAAIKKTFEDAGSNLVRGAGHLLSDLRHNGGMPSTAKPGALKVGEDLALTPGQVVDRDDRAEILQYSPTTKTVHERPVLVVPPPIGRFYFLDLRPGRSFVEYAVSEGLQTFLLSWRNPSSEQSDWEIDTYAERILEAVDVIREITGSPDVNVIGFCAGGILQTAVLNKLASMGDDRIHSASYAVTMLDFGLSTPIDAFQSARLMSFARRKANKNGVTPARSMGQAFSLMRPNDLVWNYWVNNYLLGQDPPVFDILSWNADGTNLPARLHQQFLDVFETNPMPRPGAMTCLGVPLDLGTITVPAYVTGAINDHLTPWKATFRTTQLLSSDCTFALSNAGHIASLVNPPGNPKASYFTGPLNKEDSADAWLDGATKHTGSWWEHWAEWVSPRSGDLVPAPLALGSATHPALGPAPGQYVRASS